MLTADFLVTVDHSWVPFGTPGTPDTPETPPRVVVALTALTARALQVLKDHQTPLRDGTTLVVPEDLVEATFAYIDRCSLRTLTLG